MRVAIIEWLKNIMEQYYEEVFDIYIFSLDINYGEHR